MTDRKHIDPTIYTTRPTDERLEKENRVYDLLEELSIPFVRIDHDAMNTIDECQDVDKFLGVEICKNLFLCNSQKTKFYLLMMPGHKKFVTRDFCKQINSSRLSFAPPEYMEAYLDLTPGSCWPFINIKIHERFTHNADDILWLGYIFRLLGTDFFDEVFRFLGGIPFWSGYLLFHTY